MTPESRWLWFARAGDRLSHAFTPTLRRSACDSFAWSLAWNQRSGEPLCPICVAATRRAS